MIEKYNELENYLKFDNGYVSCIRIDGTPILPPLLTPERRKKLQQYKQQAIDKEKCLELKGELRTYVRNNCLSDTKRVLSNLAINKTLELQLSFGDNAHIEALYTCKKSVNNNLPLEICETSVPSSIQISPNLCDKSNEHYIQNRNEEIPHQALQITASQSYNKLSASSVIFNLTNAHEDNVSNETSCNNIAISSDEIQNIRTEEDIELNISSEVSSPKPRMIRSNSYVLESPSPALLEHYEKHMEEYSSSTVKGSTKHKRRSLDFDYGKYSDDQLSNVSDSVRPLSVSDLPLSDSNAEIHLSDYMIEDVGDHEFFSDNSVDNKINLALENVITKASEMSSTEISDDHALTKVFNNDQPKKNVQDKLVATDENAIAVHETFSENNNLSENNFVDTETELKKVLSKIPEIYANQILNLLEQHKKEQQMRYDSFINLKTICLNQNERNLQFYHNTNGDDEYLSSPETLNIDFTANSGNITELSDNGTQTTQNNTEKEDLFSNYPCNEISPRSNKSLCNSYSQTLYSIHSSSDTLNVVNTPSLCIDDYENDSVSNNSRNYTKNLKNKLNFTSLPEFYKTNEQGEIVIFNNAQEFNSLTKAIYDQEELILNGNVNRMHQQQEIEWAASVLTAAAKGFLIRRLIRTEKIQSLIQTIKDTLICAMELHAENSDNIQPSDVELHRRLIQQVSAACYAFHDIFFSLKTSEQMEIIAFDRERRREKLKRPSSGINLSRSDSSRGSYASRRKSSVIKSKKTVM